MCTRTTTHHSLIVRFVYTRISYTRWPIRYRDIVYFIFDIQRCVSRPSHRIFKVSSDHKLLCIEPLTLSRHSANTPYNFGRRCIFGAFGFTVFDRKILYDVCALGKQREKHKSTRSTEWERKGERERDMAMQNRTRPIVLILSSGTRRLLLFDFRFFFFFFSMHLFMIFVAAIGFYLCLTNCVCQVVLDSIEHRQCHRRRRQQSIAEISVCLHNWTVCTKHTHALRIRLVHTLTLTESRLFVLLACVTE